MKFKNIVQGQEGENLACQYLEKNDFLIVHRNYKTKFGEIDIIASKDNIVAFIEVKLRSKEYFPIALVVNNTKQQKITKSALVFISKSKLSNKIYRFDIITICKSSTLCKIDHIENAFQIKNYE